MSDTERAAEIMFELSAKCAEVANGGKAHERLDELVAACERARDEVARLVKR